MALEIKLQRCFRPDVYGGGGFLPETALVVAHWRVHIYDRNKRDGFVIRARHVFFVSTSLLSVITDRNWSVNLTTCDLIAGRWFGLATAPLNTKSGIW